MFFVRFVCLTLLWFFCLAVGNGNNGIAMVCAVAFVPLTISIYMLPTYEAWKQQNTNLMSVALLNIFLGWSIIGWVVALSWAFKKAEAIPQPAHEIDRYREPYHAAPTSSPIPAPSAPSASTKVCPYCAETVLAAAIKCKHCGSDLSAEAASV